MSNVNDFLPFCGTDTGTNLLTEAEYTASADRTSGNKPGVASSKLNNRALRQANALASQLAQYVSNQTATDVLDDGAYAKLLAQVTGALMPLTPVFSRFLSSTGTHNLSYYFFANNASATVGATYTHNAVTYTIAATVSGAIVLRATGSAAPLASGTLTKASGTGDATINFYAVRAPILMDVEMVAGGGGGAGSGGGGGGGGGNGGDTTFGGMTAVKGTGGSSPQGGNGGTATLGSGPVGTAVTGGYGGSAGYSGVAIGGSGGSSPFGGAGGGGANALTGIAASANTGSGGGGGGMASGFGGGGGGAGGYINAKIFAPTGNYAWAVGAGGTAGTAGSGTSDVGGAGAAGRIEVMEYFQ